MFNSEKEQISERKLSLFCLIEEDYERKYLKNLSKEQDNNGNTLFRPIFSENAEEAYAFDSVEMANKYLTFLEENTGINFFFCILPEMLIENEEKISEEEKVVDRPD